MIRLETSWEDKWGTEVLEDLWKLSAKTGLALDIGVGEKEAKRSKEGKFKESGVSRQENSLVVRDLGYSLRRSCLIMGLFGREHEVWARNPLLYEPLFITLIDLIRHRKLGELRGIEMAFFFKDTQLGKGEAIQEKNALEHSFALELLFLLLISSLENFRVIEYERVKSRVGAVQRASAALSNNQFHGIYRSGKRAGSLLVSRRAWGSEDSLAEESKEEKMPPEDLREFSFFPYRAKGFMSFGGGTLEFRAREDTAPDLILHPGGNESYSIPLPEGSGELYFYMDIQEVLWGIKERPLYSPSLVSALVLRAEEELEYTCSGKKE